MKIILSLAISAALAILTGLPQAAVVAAHTMPQVRSLLGGVR